MPYTNHDKISEMIEETHDPVQRAVLLVLAGIARDLDSNTAATTRLAELFENHTKAFEVHDKIETRDRAYLKGAWWAGVLFMTAIQTVGGWILLRAISANDTQDTMLRMVEQRLTKIETEHTRIDRLEAELREKIERGGK